MIRIEGLSKSFRPASSSWAPWKRRETIRALQEIRWEIPQGCIAALVGPNGSGKTTLLKILATLILPDEGQVWINGCSLTQEASRIRETVSLSIGEDRGFYRRLTVRQNLEFFAALYQLSPKEAGRRIGELSEVLGLKGHLDRVCQELSSGLKQRFILARSLLNGASVLLADEPARSLDPLAKAEWGAFLQRLSREFGKTILFTTHDLREAQRIAQRVGILHQGRLVQSRRISEAAASEPSSPLEAAFAEACQPRGRGA